MLQVTKGKEEQAFYSLPEFEEWKTNTSNWNTWKIKYYKGLISLFMELETFYLLLAVN